jgi:hypothetical protein
VSGSGKPQCGTAHVSLAPDVGSAHAGASLGRCMQPMLIQKPERDLDQPEQEATS